MAYGNLYLNENNPTIVIHSKAFFNLESIQNVFVSRKILLQDVIKLIFIEMFKLKNLNFSKRALNRNYFKSLFLIASYDKYDCEMSLYFLRNNVHFNFKTERDIFDYFNECSRLVIKQQQEQVKVNSENNENRNTMIFTNGLFYIGWLTLCFILLVLVWILCI